MTEPAEFDLGAQVAQLLGERAEAMRDGALASYVQERVAPRLREAWWQSFLRLPPEPRQLIAAQQQAKVIAGLERLVAFDRASAQGRAEDAGAGAESAAQELEMGPREWSDV